MDIAAAPLYITKSRSRVVDFTVPFLNVSASMLLRRPPMGHTLRVTNLHDLLLQSEIRYGTRKDGILPSLVRTHNDSTLRILWRNIRRRALDASSAALTTTNEIGIERVRNYKYAFILSSSIAQYVSNQWPCNLISLESYLATRGYGLAVQKRAHALLDRLNSALRELKRNGYLDELYRTWWFKKNMCITNQGSYTRSNSHSIYSAVNGLCCFSTILLIMNTYYSLH